MSPFNHRTRGFTLVELVTVMILIGILGAVGASRFFDRLSFDGTAFSDQASAMLRYAQKLAVAQHRNVHVRLDGDKIALCYQFDCKVQVRAPSSMSASAACNSSTWFCLPLPRGITISGTSFFFDSGGRPYNNSDDANTAISTFVAQKIAIKGADGASYPIRIENETGYVH
jgi:MSHA pilin protein MshC